MYNDLNARHNAGKEMSIPALQCAQIICMHFQLQYNIGKDAMLAQVYIVNRTLVLLARLSKLSYTLESLAS